MKRFVFLLSLSMFIFVVWCWNRAATDVTIHDIQTDQEENIMVTGNTVVRNVNRWMSLDEVKKAEKIKESDIVDSYTENWVSWIEVMTFLNWMKFHLLYAFHDWKLWWVLYWLDDADLSDYYNFRRVLWKKYWNWEDITDEQFDEAKIKWDEVLNEANEIKQKVQDYKDWKIDYTQDELDNLEKLFEDKKKELNNYADIMEKYLFADDKMWVRSEPSYDYDEDMQISLWNLIYSHDRTLADWTLISINLDNMWLMMSYASDEMQNYMDMSDQLDIENNL